jgi:tripartite ATP-independent transporter DctP family solute receptor
MGGIVVGRALASFVLVGALALVPVVGTSPANAQSGKVVVKVGTSPPPQHAINQVLKQWGDAVAARSGNAIEVQVFPGGQLGGQKEMVEGLKLGSLQATEATIAVTNNWVKEAGVMDLPFLFRSPEHAYKVYNGPIGQWLADQYIPHGFRILGFSLAGVRQPFGAGPLNTPDDIKGKKIRVIQSPLHIDLWKLLGANPTPIPDPEIYSALQTGVVSFADNTLSNYYGRKWFEVAPTLSLLGHVYAINAMIVSEQWWQKQSPVNRMIMYDAFQKLVPHKHQLIIEEDATALAAAEKAGAKVVRGSNPELWKTATRPLWDKWATGVNGGKELIQAILETE